MSKTPKPLFRVKPDPKKTRWVVEIDRHDGEGWVWKGMNLSDEMRDSVVKDLRTRGYEEVK